VLPAQAMADHWDFPYVLVAGSRPGSFIIPAETAMPHPPAKRERGAFLSVGRGVFVSWAGRAFVS
jgi:hypothetical protein